jgi:arylsulfatase
VLFAHGDMTCGYALYIKDGRLCYDMNVGGVHSPRSFRTALVPARQPQARFAACGR